MIRSLVYRNVISAVLLIVAIVGIVVQLREQHAGIIFPQARLELMAYLIIALYALMSIVLRISAKRRRK